MYLQELLEYIKEGGSALPGPNEYLVSFPIVVPVDEDSSSRTEITLV